MSEWLVAVEPDGRILLPPVDRKRPATHYRIKSVAYSEGSFELIPMVLFTEDSLVSFEPPPGVAALNREVYDADEWDSLAFPCPHCGQPVGDGCITSESRKPLEPKAQEKSYHVRCVHKARVALMKGSQP